MKRNISRRPNGESQLVTRAGIPHEAHNLKISAHTGRIFRLERFSKGTLSLEILVGKRLVHDSRRGICFLWAKVSPVKERYFHLVEPTWRNAQKVAKYLARWFTSNGNAADPAFPAHHRPHRHRHPLNARNLTEMLRHLVPKHPWLRLTCN